VPEPVSDLLVALRPMLRADLPDLLRWRQADHVARWFAGAEALTTETIERDYGPRLDGHAPIRMSVVEANGRSIGFVQDYRLRDQPDPVAISSDPEAVAVDYAIGDPAWVGRGVGRAMLRRWLELAGERYPEAATYVAAPDHRNVASRRLLLRVGFVEGLWFDEPQPDGSVATLVAHTRDARTLLG
jgi:aminoglycoside 6'-N-acetyltransferase